jgi:hypothetical protein
MGKLEKWRMKRNVRLNCKRALSGPDTIAPAITRQAAIKAPGHSKNTASTRCLFEYTRRDIGYLRSPRAEGQQKIPRTS